MRKHRIISALLAVLLLLCAVQPAVFAAEEEVPPLHGIPLRVVASENGMNRHLETENGTRYAAAYPEDPASGRRLQAGNLPAKYDSRALGLVTPVKDQGMSGICWAFSVAACMETNAIKKGLAKAGNVDYSESHMAWYSINSKTTNKSDPTYGDGETAGFQKIYQTGGNSAYAVASIARGSGLANESDFNFERDFKAMKNYREEDRYVSVMRMSESQRIDCFENKSIADLTGEIKRAVMEYGAVSASYYASGGDDLYYKTSVDGHDTTAYYQDKTADPDLADHMVTIVGWDDNFSPEHFHPRKRPSKPGAWIIKNSWGVNAPGLAVLPDGFMYLSYEDKSLCEIVTYEAVPVSTYDRLYQYDGYFYSASFPTEQKENAAYANVFKAAEDGYISKVGFYTAEGNQNIYVCVFQNLSDLNNPESGLPVCEAEGSFPYEGFHTLDLSTLAAVKAGETFSVVVYGDKGTALSIPVEANYIGANNYSANAGESFIHLDGASDTGWVPADALSNNSIFSGMRFTICNVPVKAMALGADKHTHNWSNETYALQTTCVRDGGTVRVCSGCSAFNYVERTKAPGHRDNNGDGRCDVCDATLAVLGGCPYCHKVHGGGFDRVIAFFHRIFYFFKNLFRR